MSRGSIGIPLFAESTPVMLASFGALLLAAATLVASGPAPGNLVNDVEKQHAGHRLIKPKVFIISMVCSSSL